jgi:hypothetical protein
MPLKHLSREQHEELARLLNQAQDNLDAATRIIKRAPFTDRVLNASKQVQERLIDPLREAWDKGFDMPGNPYQSIGYARGRR